MSERAANSANGSAQINEDLRQRFDERLASPILERDERTILSIENYAPFLLNAVSSSWQRISGARYRDEFGLGITDWRVIAMLAIEPNITAQRICQVVKLDKAAVSRALKALELTGHIAGKSHGSGTRNKTWSLTESGESVHNRILHIALMNELALVNDIPMADLEICLRVLRKMHANLSALEA